MVDQPEDKSLTRFVLEMTPVIGDAMAAKEIYDELQKEEPNYPLIAGLGGAAVVGLLPGLGDAAAAGLRRGARAAANVAKRVEIDPNTLGSLGGNIRLKAPDIDVKVDVKQAEELLDDPDKMKAWQESNKLPETKRQANPEDSKQAAQELFEGKITSKEARERIKSAIPDPELYSAEQVLDMMPSVTEVTGALGKKAGKFGILGVKGFDLEAGQKISSRLDIPAYNNYDTWVVSIHDGTKDAGSVVGFGQAIRLKNIRFGSKSKEALDIARGKRRTPAGEDKPMGKSTIARIFGEYVPEDPYKLQQQAADIIASGSDEWTQVGMNPYRGSGFYIKETGIPVFDADEVIQVGPLVLAKNVKKPTISQMKEMGVKTADGKIRLFNEGGMALEEQMEMNFGTPNPIRGVDPVSGNEIPVGSTAEEVRDDIPANLSEGEMVMAADIVRFYGIKFFEDLRENAKREYARMDAEGRIGGEPMDMEEATDSDLQFDISELEVTDSPENAFLGKLFGGSKKEKSVKERFEDAKKRKSVDRVKSGTAGKPKFKNRAEEMLYNLRNRDKDRTGSSTKKEKTKSKVDFGFRGNPMERAARKYGSEPQETKNESIRKPSKPDAGKVKGAYRGGPEKEEETFAERLNFPGFDQGGVTGGFGEEIGFDTIDDITGGLMEARTYQNAAGHTMVIMFLDGEPLTPIPEGYFPVGDSTTVPADEVVEEEAASGGGGGGSSFQAPTPTPINYKELSVDELADMVQSQQSMKGDVIAGGLGIINPILGLGAKFAMYDMAKKTKQELERRLESPELPIYEREYLQNLLDIANTDKPNLIERLFGKDKDKPEVKKVLVDEDGEFIVGDGTMDTGMPDPEPVTVTELPNMDGSMSTEEIKDMAKNAIDTSPDPYVPETYDAIPPASSGFGGMGPDPAEEFGGSQTRFQQSIEPRGTTRKDRDAQRRRDRQEQNKNLQGQSTTRKTGMAQSATRGLTDDEKKGGSELDSRFGITGLKDGGLVDKPKVEKVVKGLKKASKSHAKQAEQLEKALKASKKKSK